MPTTLTGDTAPAAVDNTAAAGAQQTDVPFKGTWYEGVDNSVYEDPSLSAFKDDKGALNGQNLIKSYVHAQKTLGRDKIIPPTDNDPPEMWKDTFAKLGLPKDFGQYNPIGKDFEVSDKEQYDNFRKTAYDAGILPKQAEAVLNWLATKDDAQEEAARQAQVSYIEKGMEGLKKEYGQAFDQKIFMAQRAVKEFCPPDFVAMLDKTGYGNDPMVIKFFASLGDNLLEDTSPGVSTGGLGGKLSPDEAQEKINGILKDMDNDYYKPDRPGHADAVRNVNKLFQFLG